MTQPCTMDPAFALGFDAYRDADRGGAREHPGNGRDPRDANRGGAAESLAVQQPARPHRPEPLDPKLADMAQRLRHDAGDLRERACRLPYGARRHRLFRAALDADSAALEIEAWPEAAEIDALYPAAPRHFRHG